MRTPERGAQIALVSLTIELATARFSFWNVA